MINGDYNLFINDLHYGTEMNFSYKDRKYFIEGFYKEGLYKLELERFVPILKGLLWEYESNKSMSECAKEFMNAKIFDGKTFPEIESEVEWLDFTPDIDQETKEYWKKHPDEKPDGIV